MGSAPPGCQACEGSTGRLGSPPESAISRGESSMNAVVWLIDTIIDIAIILLIAQVILSWLVAFNVVNTRNPFVNSVGRFLYQITEPALRPIRRIIPSFGGIDISPLVLALLLGFLRILILSNLPY
jgi:YggT family protein